MSVPLPGTDVLPEPVGGSGGGIQVPDCTENGWAVLDAGTSFSTKALTDWDAEGSDLLGLDYVGDCATMLDTIFGTGLENPDQVEYSVDHVAYIEFENQRNGEIYRLIIHPQGCY